MKTIRPESDFKTTLNTSLTNSVKLSPTATVEDGLVRWLKIHTIGNKPRSCDYNRELVEIIRKSWPELQTPILQVTEAQCMTFAESVSRFSASRYNGLTNAIKTFIPIASFLPRKKVTAPDVTSKIPTPDEFDRLLAALDVAFRGKSGMVIRFLAHTGFRINEARQLLWSDVKEDHVYARAETTKSGKPRVVPFIPGTREVLRALKKFSKGDRVLPQGICHKALRYAARLTGLPVYGHHTFRHYFATRCILSGVDIPTVAKWLGHSDNGVLLLRTYCHLLDEHSVAMAQRVKLGGRLCSHPENFVELHAPRGAAETTNIVPMVQLAQASV